MAQALSAVYKLALSFWVGGMALFTFVVTPAVFRSEPRDVAARVVGAIFPLYFRFLLVLVAAAFAARLAAGRGLDGLQPSFATALLAAALLLTAWQAYVLVPRMERVKAAIPSFGPGDAHHPARREFGRLQAVSMTLHFLMLAAGAVLVVSHALVSP